LSAEAANARELIGFDGAVSCEPQAGGAALRLCGRAKPQGQRQREGPEAAIAFREPAFDGVKAPPAMQLPAVLHRVRVWELGAAGARRSFRIDSSEGCFELSARGMQLHRDAAREFFGALPTPPVPPSTRLGWLALLWILRVPGTVRLLVRLQR